MADIDTIVIGSGAGGLVAALALARAGDRVLVLEQHDVPGGWCHSFRLGGHWFSPGVHYIGELGPGGRMRRIYEGLGLGDDLTFLELNPDGYDHVMIGSERFDIPKGRERYIDRLKQRFPRESKGIDGYFGLVTRIRDEMGDFLSPRPATALNLLKMPFVAPSLMRWGLVPLERVMSRYVQDPLLKGILSIQAGDHGLGPSSAPTAVHASVQGHYFDGAWYPKGGGASLPRALVAGLKRHGGELRVRASVERILVERGADGAPKVVGVALEDGTEIRAKRVISNADPGVTYGRLLPQEFVPPKIRRALENTRWSLSALSLFFAVEDDVRARGLDSGNYWYSDSPDVESGYRVVLESNLENVHFPGQFLTVTTLKDPSKGLGQVHTLESFVFVGYEAFRRWAHTKFGERPSDYAALKESLTEKMLRGVDRIAPGLSERVVFRELGTPLTNQHYCVSTQGNLYGTEKARDQVGPFSWRIRGPVSGLFLAGQSTVGHGVLGASVSGMFAAAKAIGVPAAELLKPDGGTIRTYPSDDLSKWPDELQRRIALKRKAVGSAVDAATEAPESWA